MDERISISPEDERRLWELRSEMEKAKDDLARATTDAQVEMQRGAIEFFKQAKRAILAPYFTAPGWDGKS